MTFLISIFAPWWINPLFDRMSMDRPYPRVCLAAITTALGFVAGAVTSAWITSRAYGEASVTAAYVFGGIGAASSLVSTLWVLNRNSWMAD